MQGRKKKKKNFLPTQTLTRLLWELHPKSTCADFFPSSLPRVYSFRIRRRNKVRYHFPLRYPTGLDAVPSLAYRLSSRLAARSLCVPISCLQTNGERTCCTTSFQVVPRAFYRGPPTINTTHLTSSSSVPLTKSISFDRRSSSPRLSFSHTERAAFVLGFSRPFGLGFSLGGSPRGNILRSIGPSESRLLIQRLQSLACYIWFRLNSDNSGNLSSASPDDCWGGIPTLGAEAHRLSLVP